MDETEKYLFWIALIMLFLVYFAGATKLVPVLVSGLVALINSSSGRNAQGNYPAYAAGGPKV